MKYDLLHYSKDYNSLKSNFDKLKKEFQTFFILMKSTLVNLKNSNF